MPAPATPWWPAGGRATEGRRRGRHDRRELTVGNELDNGLIGGSGTTRWKARRARTASTARGETAWPAAAATTPTMSTMQPIRSSRMPAAASTESMPAPDYILAAGQEVEQLRAFGAGAAAGLMLTGNELNNALIGGSATTRWTGRPAGIGFLAEMETIRLSRGAARHHLRRQRRRFNPDRRFRHEHRHGRRWCGQRHRPLDRPRKVHLQQRRDARYLLRLPQRLGGADRIVRPLHRRASAIQTRKSPISLRGAGGTSISRLQIGGQNSSGSAMPA